MKFTLIYDDFSTGTRGKRFADMLAAAASEEHTIAPWRCEMLEWEGISDDVTRDAAMSDYVIFSLRGDGGLSFPVKRWVESWLDRAAAGATVIVALFDPTRSTAGHANGTRHYLRHVARTAGMDFFGHSAVAEEAGSASTRRRRRASDTVPALLVSGLLAA